MQQSPDKSKDMFDRYRSTSSETPGIGDMAALAWAKGAFKSQFSALLPQKRDARILEIGCGGGANLSALHEMGYRNCHGIDLSREQVEYARNVLRIDNVEQAELGEWLEQRREAFDCILALDVLEHLEVEQLLKAGRAIRAALRSGGTFIAQVPNGVAPINPYLFGDLTHVRVFTPQSMRQFFLLVGLSPVAFREQAPHVHGIRSAVRRMLWACVFKPMICAMMRVMQGKPIHGDIYTLNFVAVARRDDGVVPC